MDAVHPFRAMPTTCSSGMASVFSGTPESVIALVWIQWTTCSGILERVSDRVASGAGWFFSFVASLPPRNKGGRDVSRKVNHAQDGQVLRLKWECGLTNRAIARSCSISHSTVGEYLRRAKETGLNWPIPADLDEDALFRLLFPRLSRPSSRAIPCPDWSLIHTELRKKSVALRLLWVEYRESHPDGYGYSQFCELYRRWAKRLKPSMRLSHKGGEKVFVD